MGRFVTFQEIWQQLVNTFSISLAIFKTKLYEVGALEKCAKRICRFRKILQHECRLSKTGFGVAENEPSKVLAGRVTGNDLGQERKRRPDEPAMLR